MVKKGTVETQIHIFNTKINAKFDATLMDDGTLIMEFHDALEFPPGTFKIGTMKGDFR